MIFLILKIIMGMDVVFNYTHKSPAANWKVKIVSINKKEVILITDCISEATVFKCGYRSKIACYRAWESFRKDFEEEKCAWSGKSVYNSEIGNLF